MYIYHLESNHKCDDTVKTHWERQCGCFSICKGDHEHRLCKLKVELHKKIGNNRWVFLETNDYGIKHVVDLQRETQLTRMCVKDTGGSGTLCGKCLQMLFPNYARKSLQNVMGLYIENPLGMTFYRYLIYTLGKK
jgi:hypothetical protein